MARHEGKLLPALQEHLLKGKARSAGGQLDDPGCPCNGRNTGRGQHSLWQSPTSQSAKERAVLGSYGICRHGQLTCRLLIEVLMSDVSFLGKLGMVPLFPLCIAAQLKSQYP